MYLFVWPAEEKNWTPPEAQRNLRFRDATQRSAAQRNAAQRSAAQRSAAQRSAAQRSAAQRSATQDTMHYTIVYNCIKCSIQYT